MANAAFYEAIKCPISFTSIHLLISIKQLGCLTVVFPIYILYVIGRIFDFEIWGAYFREGLFFGGSFL